MREAAAQQAERGVPGGVGDTARSLPVAIRTHLHGSLASREPRWVTEFSAKGYVNHETLST